MTRAARRPLRRGALIAALAAIAVAGPAQAQPCRNPLQELTIPQRSYAQIRSDLLAARPWLYLWVPDIKTGPGGIKAFDMWLVEGVYGPAFARSQGAMDESEFQKLGKSANVRTRPIKVEVDPKAEAVSRSVTIGKDTFAIEVRVRTYVFGSDRVTVKICR